MTPTERLQAAIDRLEKQRDLANEGPWMYIDGDVVMGDENDPAMAYPLVANCDHLNDGELIVTLHRTIDAQLAVMRCALGDAEGSHDEPGAFDLAVTLADAILGAAS